MHLSASSAGSFPSKRDAWLVWVLSLAAVLEAISAIALATVGPPSLWLSRVLPLILGAAAVVMVWSLFGTSYRITGSDLVIRYGPLRWRVPVANISSVGRTNRIDASPALSLNRLELRCMNPEKEFLVSPNEPVGFVAALKQINPSITVTGELARSA
jgi:PH (Pleckstrin Homology) domain-containing protein